MGKYILRRILFFIPTLIIISLLAFIISINAPGDPLDAFVAGKAEGGEYNANSIVTQKERNLWRHKLGLDLPIFYFNITGSATPDTLYKVYDDVERNTLSHLIAQFGDWKEISNWYVAVKKMTEASRVIEADTALNTQLPIEKQSDTILQARMLISELLNYYDTPAIEARLNLLQHYCSTYSSFILLQPALDNAKNNFERIKTNVTKYKNYIPAIRFYPNNQYHRWIFGDGNWITGKGAINSRGLIRGDFGYSYETRSPVGNVIGDRIRWSLFFTLTSIILAYLISLPVGLKAAAKKNGIFDRTSSVVLFILYSMPTFWVATILLMSFANTHALHVFPPSGVQPATGIPAGSNVIDMIRIRLPYLILPTIAYTYSQLAFLSRITRVSTLEIIEQDYIRTARAKGLSERTIIYRHAFRNALLPIITVFSNVFPLAIAGSVILETVFTIPGMGLQIYHAIHAKDYPVIIDVFTLTGVLTLCGYLFADILYAVADPRISYHQNK